MDLDDAQLKNLAWNKVNSVQFAIVNDVLIVVYPDYATTADKRWKASSYSLFHSNEPDIVTPLSLILTGCMYADTEDGIKEMAVEKALAQF